MTERDEDDEPTEKDLDRDERAALRLARLPEAKLRGLPMRDLRKAYDAATDIWVGQFLSEEERKRVAAVGIARHVDAPPREETKKRKRPHDDGSLKL